MLVRGAGHYKRNCYKFFKYSRVSTHQLTTGEEAMEDHQKTIPRDDILLIEAEIKQSGKVTAFLCMVWDFILENA